MIALAGVGYTYPHTRTRALDGVDLAIRKGECVLVTGPSGAGKSTLCLAASGILHHEFGGGTEGTITIAGRDVREYPTIQDIASRVGVIFDDAEAQLIFTTVEEEILSALEHRGCPHDEIAGRLEYILETTRLTILRDRAPHALSGGQKQRVALAAALALDTDVLILDEPTSELDAHSTLAIAEILAGLKKKGKTILLTEHKIPVFSPLADRLVVMENGRVIASGKPGELLSDGEIREKIVTDFRGIRNGTPLRGGSGGDPVIAFESVTFCYGQIEALKKISLTVMPGDFVAVVGENGSGKTTLIKHLNGLLRPTSGTVHVGGRDTAGRSIPDLARQVGLVFQNPDHMFFADTVAEEIAFGVKNIGNQDPAGRVTQVLNEVRLDNAAELYPRWLSRGERQRLAIACVLAMAPEVIVLDEPTTGLDAREARSVMEILKRLQREGHTILLVTHNRDIAEQCADRIITMDDGKITQDRRCGQDG